MLIVDLLVRFVESGLYTGFWSLVVWLLYGLCLEYRNLAKHVLLSQSLNIVILPERFMRVVIELQAALPALLNGSYPVGLAHSDLNEMNVPTDTSNSKITGVVEWAGASILPFGLTLYALENALSSMGWNGWKCFDNADDLRRAF